MGFQRRLSHMAAVTKWKADQQMRLMRSQSDVRELEGKLEAQKLALADAILAAHAEGTLDALDLLPLIGAVDELKAQIEVGQAQLEAIKAEEPPEMEGAAPAAPAQPAEPVEIEAPPVEAAPAAPAIEVGLPPAAPAVAVAAVEVGVPAVEPAVVPPLLEIGMPPAEPTRAAPAVEAAPAAQPVLVCPECGHELTGRFCPEHGLQGVPKVEEPPAAPAAPARRVCPECGRELTGRFCPEHGLEGVPAP